MSIRCLNEKGEIRFIPERLATMPDYMRRHNLTVDNIELQEPLKPLKEVNLSIEQTTDNTKPNQLEVSGNEITKEQYWAMLDAKGVDYK